jgi:ferredoxin--NADP+ reductase
MLSPVRFVVGADGHLAAVELARNELVADESGRVSPRDTGERETIEVGLAFRAIGYRGLPLPDVSFDERSATIPHASGRVLDRAGGKPLPGEYVVGWIKRGPSGVIGTNKKDAQETVDSLLADLAGTGASELNVPSRQGADAIERLLVERRPELVTYTGWEAIDRHERALGERVGRPRVKLTRIEEMLRVAAAEGPEPGSEAEPAGAAEWAG